MSELKEVRVADLYGQCSFPMRADAIAMSDCCHRSATSAVEYPSGDKYWRCTKHRGMINETETGPVHETILTERDVHESLVVSWPQRS